MTRNTHHDQYLLIRAERFMQAHLQQTRCCHSQPTGPTPLFNTKRERYLTAGNLGRRSNHFSTTQTGVMFQNVLHCNLVTAQPAWVRLFLVFFFFSPPIFSFFFPFPDSGGFIFSSRLRVHAHEHRLS